MKIAIALSGGVDSSVAASMLLQDPKLEVIAVTLRLQSTKNSSKSCADDTSVARAQKAAENLGIQHHILDISDSFNDIILKYAWEEYKSARTPCPCVLCNERIKFGLLLDFVQKLGCDAIATGHYAQIKKHHERFLLYRGVDPNKDQSYFLAGLTSEQLSKVIFPLGGFCKEEIREIAKKRGLISAELPDSQNVCITQEGKTFSETLYDIFGGKVITGNFIDHTGKKLKKHQGIFRYTVGQRHGLGDLIPTKPCWVQAIQPPNVIVTPNKNDLYTTQAKASQARWNTDCLPTQCSVQVRYRSQPVLATITHLPHSGSLSIQFQNPILAVTPGQAAVFYDENRVLGRAWLD